MYNNKIGKEEFSNATTSNTDPLHPPSLPAVTPGVSAVPETRAGTNNENGM